MRKRHIVKLEELAVDNIEDMIKACIVSSASKRIDAHLDVLNDKIFYSVTVAELGRLGEGYYTTIEAAVNRYNKF